MVLPVAAVLLAGSGTAAAAGGATAATAAAGGATAATAAAGGATAAGSAAGASATASGGLASNLKMAKEVTDALSSAKESFGQLGDVLKDTQKELGGEMKNFLLGEKTPSNQAEAEDVMGTPSAKPPADWMAAFGQSISRTMDKLSNDSPSMPSLGG